MTKLFRAAEFLLPQRAEHMQAWAVPDTIWFGSHPEDLAAARVMCKGRPSTLQLQLPPVYWNDRNLEGRVESIYIAMQAHKQHVLRKIPRGFVYVERRTAKTVRQSLVGVIDLEAYSDTAPMPVRPLEPPLQTHVAAHIQVRKGAELEASSALALLHDAEQNIIEPLAKQKKKFTPLYRFNLMLHGGHIAGWAVTDATQVATLETAIANSGAGGTTLAVVDGGLELSACKAHWDCIKENLAAAQRVNHPARFCIAEVVNAYSAGFAAGPLYRALYGTERMQVYHAFVAFLQAQGAELCPAAQAKQSFVLPGDKPDGCDLEIHIKYAPHIFAGGTLDRFISSFCAKNRSIAVDYIYGVDALRSLCYKGAVGIVLAGFPGREIFTALSKGALPERSVHVGDIAQKRFYLECRDLSAE